MDAQRIFGDFISNSMLTDLLKRKRIREKNVSGLDLSGAGPAHWIPALTARCTWEGEVKLPDRRGPLVSGLEGQSGTERPGPLDQVRIDGPWPSSSSGRGERLETLAGSRSHRGSPLGLLR
jgi:hypothetical protein